MVPTRTSSFPRLYSVVLLVAALLGFGACGDQQLPTDPARPEGPRLALVSSTASAERVSAGELHTCGVRTDGTVTCWGVNGFGQAPASVIGTFSQVSAGSNHSCGVKTDGTAACWGQNAFGQATPPSGTFSQVSAGGIHTCGLMTGTVACWGDNSVGQATPPSGTFSQVSAGQGYTCGLKTDGTVACWGDNSYGQTTPPSEAFSQVSAGFYHACGVQTDGTVACWGRNDEGQATPPSGTFSQVDAGGYHTCGVKTDGTVACWGRNSDGQSSPPGGPFSQVSAGGFHTCGLKTDGTVACWGDHSFGQATPPSGTFNPPGGVPVSLFLRGRAANPTLYLDDVSPTRTTARFKDSPVLTRSGGNAWKAVGTWTALPGESNGTLTAPSDAHLWLGVKNTGDVGARFDIRVEVRKNGVVVASGEKRCIKDVQKHPNFAKESTTTFAPFAPVTFNGTTDVLSLRVRTRIGTGPSCNGKAAATLRTYYDATGRPARLDATF